MIESPARHRQEGTLPSSFIELNVPETGQGEISTPPRQILNEWTKLEIEATAGRLAAVAHPLRLAIVCLLAQGERSVNEICDALWTSQPNISQHLSVLHNRNLVHARKEANRIFYALSDDRLRALLPLICCAGIPPKPPA